MKKNIKKKESVKGKYDTGLNEEIEKRGKVY